MLLWKQSGNYTKEYQLVIDTTNTIRLAKAVLPSNSSIVNQFNVCLKDDSSWTYNVSPAEYKGVYIFVVYTYLIVTIRITAKFPYEVSSSKIIWDTLLFGFYYIHTYIIGLYKPPNETKYRVDMAAHLQLINTVRGVITVFSIFSLKKLFIY